jgi:hypothetical protein
LGRCSTNLLANGAAKPSISLAIDLLGLESRHKPDIRYDSVASKEVAVRRVSRRSVAEFRSCYNVVAPLFGGWLCSLYALRYPNVVSQGLF